MAKKTIFFDEYCDWLVAAMTEHGKITEFGFEKANGEVAVGNVYKGRVENLLEGMQAAFINCGLEKNCYLSTQDILPDAGKYDGQNGENLPSLTLKEGDEIMVQVTKLPVGTKGARVTAFPSFVGKNLIYMPDTPFVGVSRKISDEELRKTLIYSAGKLKRPDEGLVLRTAAPYAKREDLILELEYMRNVYAEVKRLFETAEAGTLLYSDDALPERVMRDTLSYDIEQITVGTPRLEKLINELVSLHPSATRIPVVLQNSGRDMFDVNGLADQISEMVSPRVNLDNGAYLIIEKTEALTVIDVNTGKFTGDDSLEQTVYYTNILAAREIARQVRLRNIGGIVVVDFIDMTDPAHKKSLIDEFELALKSDSAKCAVSPVSKLGLVEFSRKRTGTSPLTVLTKTCRHCKVGYIKSPRFSALGIRAKILNLYADGNKLIRVDLSAVIWDEISVWREYNDELKERLEDAEVYFVPHKGYSDSQANCRAGNDCLPLPPAAVRVI